MVFLFLNYWLLSECVSYTWRNLWQLKWNNFCNWSQTQPWLKCIFPKWINCKFPALLFLYKQHLLHTGVSGNSGPSCASPLDVLSMFFSLKGIISSISKSQSRYLQLYFLWKLIWQNKSHWEHRLILYISYVPLVTYMCSCIVPKHSFNTDEPTE